jgi:hypothetical protein
VNPWPEPYARPQAANRQSSDELQRTILLVECATDATGCVVYFEPEGAEHALGPGESFRVEAIHPVGYVIEVMYGTGSVTLWAPQTWGTRAFKSDGTELTL